MQSQLFASFCDDWFDKTEVSNMLVYMNISRNGFNLEEMDNENVAMTEKFEKRLDEVTQNLLLETRGSEHLQNRLSKKQVSKNISQTDGRASTQVRYTKSKPYDTEAIYPWPKNIKMDFCWRLPVDS